MTPPSADRSTGREPPDLRRDRAVRQSRVASEESGVRGAFAHADKAKGHHRHVRRQKSATGAGPGSPRQSHYAAVCTRRANAR
jgi:hypothetical protein